MENVGFLRGKCGGIPNVNAKPRLPSYQQRNGNVGFKEAPDAVVGFVAPPETVSCTTFNILAPIYKRVNGEDSRESQFRDVWLSRNRSILKMLLSQNSSIICLQEFWLGSDELVNLYEQSLAAAGYDMFKLSRTNNRGDGLFTAIKKDMLTVLDYEELAFNDCGDRVAQFMRLQSRTPLYRRSIVQEVLLVNTHLIFPHNSNFCLVRLRQVYKILKYIEDYRAKHNLSSVPVLLCGDWNGSKRGQVYRFLRSQGFVSSYDVAHQYTDSDAHRWISHRNHRGNFCGVDFIWLQNPSKQELTLRDSWKEAVFGIIKSKLLREHGKEGRDAFSFFQQSDDDFLTYQDFHAAMTKLELTKDDLQGLSTGEVEELITKADFDGNGAIDYKEFEETLFSLPVSPCAAVPAGTLWTVRSSLEAPCPELVVTQAFFHPPEVEQGKWPEDYSLSDHAPLTATFTPSYVE